MMTGGGVRTTGGGGAITIGGGGKKKGGGGETRLVGDGVSLMGVGDTTGVTGFCRTEAATSRKSCSQARPVGSWGVSRGVLEAARGCCADAEWGRGGMTGSGVGGKWGALGGGGTAVGVEVGVNPPPDALGDLDLVFLFMSLTWTPIS